MKKYIFFSFKKIQFLYKYFLLLQIITLNENNNAVYFFILK